MRSKLRANWTAVGPTALLLFILSTVSIQPARAQTQDSQTPDLQELNKKIEQLEKELEEVKGQMRAATAAQKPSTAPQNPAEAKKPAAQPEPMVAVPSEAVIAQPQAGTVPLEGEITEPKGSVSFYGFAMLDSGYDFAQVDPNWFDVVRPTQVAFFPQSICAEWQCLCRCAADPFRSEVIDAYQVRRFEHDLRIRIIRNRS